MNFQELLAKMQELDAPKTQTPVEIKSNEGNMPPAISQEPQDKANMSININAQGDAIGDILKLMKMVNPDMINQPEKPSIPTVAAIPSIGATITPINKIIPDFDGDNDAMPGGEANLPTDYDKSGDLDAHEKDHADEIPLLKTVDRDGDGDHDMDDHDMEKDDKKEKEEAYANEPDEDERDINYITKKVAGGMNRPKGTHPKVAGADNPMQRVKEGEDLRDSIKQQLLKALEETKGAK
jgi:hypothetical protein